MRYAYDDIAPAETFDYTDLSDDPRLGGWTDFLKQIRGQISARKQGIADKAVEKERRRAAKERAAQQQAGFGGIPWMWIALGVAAIVIVPRIMGPSHGYRRRRR